MALHDEIKTTLIVCITILLAIALVAGGLTVFRAVKQVDTRTIGGDYTLTLSAPPDFRCDLLQPDPGTVVVKCVRRK